MDSLVKMLKESRAYFAQEADMNDELKKAEWVKYNSENLLIRCDKDDPDRIGTVTEGLLSPLLGQPFKISIDGVERNLPRYTELYQPVEEAEISNFVGEDVKELINAAVSAEREACAALVRNYPRKPIEYNMGNHSIVSKQAPDLNEIADAILARGE